MNLNWKKLGGQAGILLALVGFVLLFLGWNGAASYNFLPAQFPYLISGGLAGLSLVVLGAALLIVQNAREERAILLHALAEIREAVERSALGAGTGVAPTGLLSQAEAAGLVVAGGSSFHRPSCHLVEGRGTLQTMTVEQAEAAGLDACRACDPTIELSETEAESAGSSRRRSR